MKIDKTLLIMAAGLGSRYGGLKQVEKMGPSGEFIIDYSIYDAIEAGFTKVVFIIKKENYEIFKETIGKRVEEHIKTEYVFQDDRYIPEKYLEKLKTREKPLGTGYAILCAKEKIEEPFAVINADDFYGRDAYIKASITLENLKYNKPYQYAMIGYAVKNTMTENGAVKRGVCEVEEGRLVKITECSIEKEENKIIATPLKKETPPFEIGEETIVSMNMSLFTPNFFPYLEEKFLEFLEENEEDLSTCEFFIPDVMFRAIKEGYATVDVLKTTSTWYGVTYKEDAKTVKENLQKLVDRGIYHKNLWKKIK